MNAISSTPPHAREKYAAIVGAFLPGCEGEELLLRCSILLMRDRAGQRMRSCSDDAYPLLAHVHRMGLLHGLASMAPADLAELRRLLVMTFANASGFEGLAQGRAA